MRDYLVNRYPIKISTVRNYVKNTQKNLLHFKIINKATFEIPQIISAAINYDRYSSKNSVIKLPDKSIYKTSG